MQIEILFFSINILIVYFLFLIINRNFKVYQVKPRIEKTKIKILNNLKFLENIEKKILDTGVVDESKLYEFMFIHYIMPFILSMLIFLLIKSIIPSIIIFLMYFSLAYIRMYYSKKNKNLVFQKNAYKIYKFLNNQYSAGVRFDKSILNLYEVVRDRKLKMELKKMGATYAYTGNIDLALEEILNFNKGFDVETLCLTLRQGVLLGNNMETLKNQEVLMFKKYFNYIQMETENEKIKSFIIISLFCFVIILLIGIPLIIEMGSATSKIFA